MIDPYEILGVDRDATHEEIQKAYRKAAKETHPDAGGDAEAFKKVSEAGEILCDPVKRAQYDRSGRVDDLSQEVERIVSSMVVDMFDRGVSDPIRSMCETTDRERFNLKDERAARERRLRSLRTRVTKFAAHNEGTENTEARDLILCALGRYLDSLEQAIQGLDRRIEVSNRVLEYLNGLSSPSEGVDMSSPFTMHPFLYGTTSS